MTEENVTKSSWCKNRDRAIDEGSKISSTSISLDSLVGNYNFMWDNWTDMESMLDLDDEETFITLKLDSGSVTGSFLWWRKVGSFQKLTRDNNEESNYWDMEKVEWSDPEEYTPEEEEEEEDERQAYGHGLAVLKTLDDRGNPFIELVYNGGDKGLVRALGKKMDANVAQWEQIITETEAVRLHKDGVVALEMHGCEGEYRDDENAEAGRACGDKDEKVEQEDPAKVVGGTKRKATDGDSERAPKPRLA